MQSDEKTTYDELLWSVHYWQVSGKIPNLDETSASNYQKKMVSSEFSPMK
jgi:hypothetical protein